MTPASPTIPAPDRDPAAAPVRVRVLVAPLDRAWLDERARRVRELEALAREAA